MIDRFGATEDPIRRGMATVMLSFLAGPFVGRGGPRRDQGSPRVGVRVSARRGATSVGPTVSAMRGCPPGPDGADVGAGAGRPRGDPEPSAATELMPSGAAVSRRAQTEALHRREVMRKARSKEGRAARLAELERGHRELPSA